MYGSWTATKLFSLKAWYQKSLPDDKKRCFVIQQYKKQHLIQQDTINEPVADEYVPVEFKNEIHSEWEHVRGLMMILN